MINASIVTRAAHALLVDGLSSDYKIDRGDYVNMNADACPWVGVYRGDRESEPHTLGPSNSWKARFTFKLGVQASNL